MNQKQLLPPVSCQYGAPMGRPRNHSNPQAKVRLFKVELIDGDYDVGGAYWGGPPSQPLYAAIGPGFQDFTRANSRAEAKQTLLEEFPDLKFHR